MPTVKPFLWFNGNLEEAMNFYMSVFKNAKIISADRWGEPGPDGKPKVKSGTFEIEGQTFMALDGGPHYTFSPAISLFVSCETQAEVDELWDKLSASGTNQQCGWLQDQFGLSWQIIPTVLGKLLHDKDRVKSGRVMNAMMQMQKLDIAALQKAYDG
jgi:predicted 3-demethylubiquinone-9 3-methyltransferase (glyoxalase superfamily)